MASLFSTIHHKILRCLLDCRCLLGKESNNLQRSVSNVAKICLSIYAFFFLLMAFVSAFGLHSASWLLTAVISFLWNAFLFEPLTKTASLLWSFKKQKKTFLKRYVVSGIAPEGTVSLTQVAEAVLATCQTASTPAVPTGFGENFGIGKPPRQGPCSRIVGALGGSSTKFMSNTREMNTRDGNMFHERLLAA